MNEESNDYLWQRRHDIKVRALMNRMYYQERQRIFGVKDLSRLLQFWLVLLLLPMLPTPRLSSGALLSSPELARLH